MASSASVRCCAPTYDAGYRGACKVEIFSQDVGDSLCDGDLEAVITRSRTGVEAAWNKAGVA